jgi:hypothetical protein
MLKKINIVAMNNGVEGSVCEVENYSISVFLDWYLCWGGFGLVCWFRWFFD